VDVGPETPAFYLLIPSSRVEELVELDLRLAKDEDFLKAAEPFWNATAAAPAFQRVEISMLAAFEGWPKLTPPASAATKGKRIFQLRTYESPSEGEHVRKVEMFQSGILWRHADWRANAESYLYAQLCRPGRTGGGVGALPQRPGMEETLRQSAVRLRSDCDECDESLFESAGVFASLGTRD
jgi:hypothetical protein